MADRTSSLKEEIEVAKEAVEGLPEPLKTRTYDKLLERIIDNRYAPATQKKKTKHKSRQKKPKGKRAEPDPVVEQILKELNRTKYPKIHKLTSALDKSLYLMKIVRDELKIESLNPSQIERILKDKFLIKVTKAAVSMALMKTPYVDRTPTTYNGAKTYDYKLMMSGEEYLQKMIEDKQ